MVFSIVDFVRKTFRPSKGEKFLFMVDDSDEKRNEVVEKWVEVLSSADFLGIEILPILYHAQTGRNAAPLTENGVFAGREVTINDVLKDSDIVWSLPRYSATRPLYMLKSELGFRVGSSPNFQLDMLDTVMTEDPSHIQQRGELLLSRVKKAYELFVEFETGDKVQFDINNVPWEEDLGKIFKGEGMELGNIPFGEICSPQYEGSLFHYLNNAGRTSEAVALLDFYKEMGRPLASSDGKIRESDTEGIIPIYHGEELVNYIVENGFVKHIRGQGKVAQEQREKLAQEPLWGYIAEVAFGLNSKARSDSPFTLENEKSAIHFAIGNSAQAGGFPTPFAVKELEHHQDYTLVNPVVKEAKLRYLDGTSETVIRNGKYTVFNELNF